MTQNETPTATYTIYAYLAETLETRIERANRRAARNGLQGYTLTLSSAAPEPVWDEDLIDTWHRDENGNADYPLDGCGRPLEPFDYRQRVTATISGIVPVIPGQWELIGLVEEDMIAGPMPRLLTDEAQAMNLNLDAYRDADDWNDCDHCGMRRDRAKVYLVRSRETGAIARIGSSCLTDFLGVEARIPEETFRVMKDAEDMKEAVWAGGSEYASYRIADVLAIAHAMIRDCGWVSSDKARCIPGATSTGERVSTLIRQRGRQEAAKRREMIDSVPTELVAEMIEYARNLRDADDSEYARTISAIVRGQHEKNLLVSGRNLRIMASVAYSFQRAKLREFEAGLIIDSDYVGEVGKRQTFPQVKVIFTRKHENYYGTTTLVKFLDQAGNVLVWWNSGSTKPEVGKTYNMAGTPKTHEERDGVKQTVLTRCKLVEC